ncbi:hypothetical protein [Rhizobium lentis]|uniref:Uncharacterized protein n=1 Tax=Rhizobium lentis TaxID=1138194 RepID=A0A9Q3MCC0_9HYPH|nr:hypothetical protein [Rhizobium lentis]MBX5025531.1 hypothetical protein [Rhizobium lentis]
MAGFEFAPQLQMPSQIVPYYRIFHKIFVIGGAKPGQFGCGDMRVVIAVAGEETSALSFGKSGVY